MLLAAAATAAALPSPDLTTSPRRSPRKHQQQENQPAAGSPPIAVHMGGVPKLTTLFRNHAFLVTHGEVKRQTLKEKSSSDSTDGSSGDGESLITLKMRWKLNPYRKLYMLKLMSPD